jgi:hypothetical protein
MFVTMGRGLAAIGGVARPAGTTGDGAGQSCAVRTTLTAVICAGVEISDRAAGVAIGLSLQGAALGRARVVAVGWSLLEVEEAALPVDSLLQEAGAAGRAVVEGAAAGRVAVEAGRVTGHTDKAPGPACRRTSQREMWPQFRRGQRPLRQARPGPSNRSRNSTPISRRSRPPHQRAVKHPSHPKPPHVVETSPIPSLILLDFFYQLRKLG